MVDTILGRKIGMTRIFDENGTTIPVTAISVGPCVILGHTDKNIRLGYEDIEEKDTKKPQLGMFKKLNVSPKRIIREVRNRTSDQEVKVGSEVKVDIFKKGDFVDVVGISIGKGFAGGMKRWNWKCGDMAHGSMSHRRPGSSGSNTTPGRVFKGHHLPGHLGNSQTTVQNLKIMKVDLQNNIILVKGQAPGYKSSLLIIGKAKKKQNKA
ncbi:MAG: 50S ribosomal protein L3 [Candidatus Omnitrophica bacterium]|nr:50S ribosomal protein L3 [Candidatus Omnitrophota bacterium]MDD5352201.1 50S ribosomal protein L3 [Candidatus Omnitrophota bacterium]MDD5549799.1 50S ribosomal protein L3 [Candidatus Omnitrophota bacterium]